MTTLEAVDYLAKQLLVSKSIVTYRSLSRALSIHVNTAKLELAAYYAESRASSLTVSATYLVSGEVDIRPSRHEVATQEEDEMEIDYDEDMEDEEAVTQTKMVLVGESALEDAKRQFTRISTTHVYCLSPSPLVDAGLICGPTEAVRGVDLKSNHELTVTFGKIVGADVQKKSVVKGKSAQAPIRTASIKAPQPRLATKAEEPETKDAEKDKVKKVGEKPIATGKLDWSKAKSKEVKKEDVKAKMAESSKEALKREEKMSKEKSKDVSVKNGVKNETTDKETKVVEKEQPKRGLKRKSTVTSLSSDEEDTKPSPSTSKPPSVSKVRVKKGVLVSDDEEEATPPPPKTKAKGKTVAFPDIESDVEKSLQAMMDIDDDQVEKVSRSTTKVEAIPEPNEDGDVDMEEEPVPAPKPKPRKRKEKKEIPVGRNGLKKKRVVKSRTACDDKGYMATEDYSSYESVDEEEPVPEPPKKAQKAKKPDAEATVADSETKPKAGTISRKGSMKLTADSGKAAKVAQSSKKAQNLKDFFGKPKK
ncbi:hypothetical protein JAAARDRAFT_162049 [Jaapia argillacea MUCL 33604]|uniref:DNA polymerase delta subunit 3 n=1 Tax=Jaapia argillacea MUCL 33604 TaxID=933084 RepID=A0A067PS67_9AGAM|nr:hypothetical protein JAAARDRAFT_162049 [Jaapia argillacea MUCL 33604]